MNKLEKELLLKNFQHKLNKVVKARELKTADAEFKGYGMYADCGEFYRSNLEESKVNYSSASIMLGETKSLVKLIDKTNFTLYSKEKDTIKKEFLSKIGKKHITSLIERLEKELKKYSVKQLKDKYYQKNIKEVIFDSTYNTLYINEILLVLDYPLLKFKTTPRNPLYLRRQLLNYIK